MCSGNSQAARLNFNRSTWALWAFLFFSCLACAQTDNTSPSLSSTALLAGIPFRSTKQQSANEYMAYRFATTEGGTYLVQVDQHGLDFSVTIESPEGAKSSYNSPLFRDESEFILLRDTPGGEYTIKIGSQEATGARGTHTILVSALDNGVEDSRSIEAWRLMSEGAAANADGSRTRPEDALAAYEAAAGLWKTLGESRRHAQAIYSVAILNYWGVYEYAASARHAADAAELYRTLDEQTLYANAMFVQAYSIIEIPSDSTYDEAQRAYEESLDLFGRSYEIHQQLGNLYDQAHVANNIALTYYYRAQRSKGDYRQARKFWDEALGYFVSLGESRHELNVRQNLVIIDIEEGYAASAADAIEKIIDELPEGDSPLLRGIVLGNLGQAYRVSGQFDRALEAYTASRAVTQRIGELGWESYALRGLGSTYVALGELDRAVGYLHQARDLAKEADYARVEAAALMSLGNISYWTADYSAALQHHEAAFEMTQSEADRDFLQAFFVSDLVALGRYDDAVSMASELLSEPDITEVTRADLLQELGRSYLGLGGGQEAASYFEEALDIYSSLGLQGEQADVFNGLALAARAQGDLAAALDYGDESLRHFENLRHRVEAPELRAVYSATRRGYYETQLELLMAAYEDGESADDELLYEALSVSERSRARVMMELLDEASIKLDRDIPQATSDRQRELIAELAAQQYQRDYFVLEKVDPDEEAQKEEALSALNSSIADITNDLTLLEIELRRDNPRYSGFSSSEPLTADQIQATVDSNSILLQYALGPARSFLWVVTDESIESVELADRDTIELAAREAFESLRTFEPDAKGRRRLDQRLRALADYVIAPAANLLDPDRERIFVALEGALQYIPFGVLPIEQDGALVPLLEVREIIGVPSVSVLSAVRERRSSQTPSKVLAVFADPVFEETDSRISRRQNVAVTAVQPEFGNFISRSSFGRRLARLPGSGAEGRAIAELVPTDSLLLVTGLGATRDAVLSADLNDYRFIHFATHGLVDSRYPALSALALSRFDEHGITRNSFLRLHDIYSLDLNADLVVLSACETALGREVRGEGLIGLTQGFLYAGAKTLVVSLWPVPDGPTADLMTRFYAYMFDDDLRPAEALRRAQISLADERSDPYFWGAFIVLGDG